MIYLLIGLLALGLAGEAQATSISSASIDWSKSSMTFSPGAERWQVVQVSQREGSGILIDNNQGSSDFSTDGSPTQHSAEITDQLGHRGGESSTDHGLLTTSSFAETVDLRSWTLGQVQSGASMQRLFEVSGQGSGSVTVSVPYHLEMTRDGLATGQGGSVFALATFDTISQGSREFILYWDDSLHVQQNGVFTFSQTFLNPNRAGLRLNGTAITYSTTQSLPEPSSLLLLAIGMGLVMWKRARLFGR